MNNAFMSKLTCVINAPAIGARMERECKKGILHKI